VLAADERDNMRGESVSTLKAHARRALIALSAAPERA
jgi:hypothetical protein